MPQNEAIMELMRRQGMDVRVDPVTGQPIVGGRPAMITGTQDQGYWQTEPPAPPPQPEQEPTPVERADTYDPLAFVQRLKEKVGAKTEEARIGAQERFTKIRKKAAKKTEALREKVGDITGQYEEKIGEAQRQAELGAFVHTLSDALARYGAIAMTGVGAMKAGLRPRDFYVEPQAGKMLMNLAREKKRDLQAAREGEIGREVSLSNRELATQLGIDEKEADTLLKLSESEAENIFKFGQAEASALLDLQRLNPDSNRSQHMRAFIAKAYPKFVDKIGIENLNEMSYDEMATYFKVAQDQEEREWSAQQDELDRELKRAQTEAAQAHKRSLEGRLPDKTIDELRDMKSTLDAIKRAREMYPKAKATTGPFLGRINQVLNKVGMADADYTELQAELGSLLASYMKSISGAAISEPEARRLAALLPRTSVTPEMFETLLERFETDVRSRHNNTLDLYEKQGRDVEQFKLPGTVEDKTQKLQVRHRSTGTTVEVPAVEYGSWTPAQKAEVEVIGGAAEGSFTIDSTGNSQFQNGMSETDRQVEAIRAQQALRRPQPYGGR